jgi:hypothetical protein
MGEKEGVEWVVSERVAAVGRNDPSLVCTYKFTSLYLFI